MNLSAPTTSNLLSTLGDFRWLRAHVSFYAVGVVVLVVINVLVGGPRLWSLTATGIWSLLIFIHLVLVAIARLSTELLADDEEEIVLLPVKDAVLVDPTRNFDPASTWSTVEPAEATNQPNAEDSEQVSWQIATNAAQARRQTDETPESPS